MNTTFIHGFTQTGESWRPILDRGRFGDATCFDAPGHGASAPMDTSLWAVADTLASTMARGGLVGYSMGGRIALHIALAHPTLVSRLVLISSTPGLRSDNERSERRAGDERLAQRITEIGVNTFIDEWMRGPLFATYTPDDSDLRARRANSAVGLASSLIHQGTGSQDDLWPRLGELRMPVLLITGELDTKFTDIAQRMRTMIADATLVTVRKAGHSVHLERPDVVAQLLTDFLDA